MSAPGRIAAVVVAAALVSPPARAAAPARSSFRLRETYSIRYAKRPGETVVSYARSFTARIVLRTDPASTDAPAATTAVTLRIGAFQFGATLARDPRWAPASHGARFDVPDPDRPPGAPPIGSVVVAWRAGRVAMRVNVRDDAYLGGIVRPSDAAGLSIDAEAVAGFGADSRTFAGSAKGRAGVGSGTLPNRRYEDTVAKLRLVGVEK